MAKSLESNFLTSLKFYAENLFFLSLTYFFSPLLYFFILLRGFKKARPGDFKILIIQIAKIGDLVCSTPVFREIKKKYPNAHLAVLIIAKTRGIIFQNPYLDEIIVLDESRYRGLTGFFRLLKKLAEVKFNISVSLAPTLLNNILPLWLGIPKRISFISKYVPKSVRWSFIFTNYRKEFLRTQPAFRQYLSVLRFIGVENPDEKRELFISQETRKKASDFLLKNGVSTNDFLVGISVSSGNPIKDWGLEKFAELADKLIENLKAKIIFIGSGGEKELVSQTTAMMRNSSASAAGVFSLEEVGGLMEHLKLFISVDTGPLYIANALDVPVVDIIGPFNVIEQLDLNGKCEAVSKDLPCFPCVHIMPSVYVCREGHFRCTKDVSVNDVYEAVLRLKKKYDF